MIHRTKLIIVVAGSAFIFRTISGVGFDGKESDSALVDLFSMRTMSANFSQVVFDAEDKREISSSAGTVLFRKPDLVKWSYDKPINQVFIKNKTSFSVYDRDLMQLSKINRYVDQDTPIDFLIKDYQTFKTFYDVDRLNNSGNLSFVKLSPLVEKSDYEKIIIVFKNSVINKIEIFYRIGRIIEIKFDMVQINLELNEGDFELDAPPNVEVEEIN